MSIYDVKIDALDGSPFDLSSLEGREVLVVNVASRCGLTPQYTGLEELQRALRRPRLHRARASPATSSGVRSPAAPRRSRRSARRPTASPFRSREKVDVNGQQRHPLYQRLTETPDREGEAGDIQWNSRNSWYRRRGEIVARFRPRTEPGSEDVVEAIEANLP